MENKKPRIEWIDGLKGLACILVFVHHFLLALYPATYYGMEADSHSVNGIDTMMSYTPWGVLINGNFYVNTFILISAFLLCSQVLKAIDSDADPIRKISSIALKRYPRLMLPTLAAGTIYYLIVYIGYWVGLTESTDGLQHSFLGMIYTLVIKMWIARDMTVIGNFWMLQPLFIGSFLAILLGIMAGKNRKWYVVIPVYALAAYVFGSIDHYMWTISLGCMVAYIVARTQAVEWLKSKKWLAIVLGIVLLVFGIYLGGYPSYQAPEACPTTYYRWLDFFYYRVPGIMEIMHAFGAFFLVWAFLLLSPLAKAFSCKPLKWLGSISYGVYALHPIPLEILTYRLAGVFAKIVEGRDLICLMTFIALLIIVLIMSQLFKMTVEKYVNKLVAMIK